MPGRLASLLRGGAVASSVDLSVQVGQVALSSPVMCASGTAGHGAELGAFFNLSDAGAIVVKSLSPEPWQGNPAPRVHETASGMINSIGLQGPGVQGWIDSYLEPLNQANATIVASIWGRSVAEYARAAELMAPVADRIAALEVNVSCPNVEDRNTMFAHSPSATREVMAATSSFGMPTWAKLSPNIGDIVPIAEAAVEGGADALTLINTMMGLALDIETARPRLGNGGGGLSGPAIRPIAVRAVYETRAALPDTPIIGVGGINSGEDAIEFLMAGAQAVQVGTATFADPKSVVRIADEIALWCQAHRVRHVGELTNRAHEEKNT